MLNSIVASQMPHEFIYRGHSVSTDGNKLSHAILRGGVNKFGQSIPNYHYEDLERLYEMYCDWNLENPAVIVDVNHSNSNKRYKEQIRISNEVMHSRNYHPQVKKMVKGLMIESYLEEGAQSLDKGNLYGKSITDPCLGWSDTEQLIYQLAERA